MNSSTYLKDLNVILDELQKIVEKEKQDKDHLNNIKKLLKSHEYDRALMLVQKKIDEGIFKSAYQKKLKELLIHLKFKDEKDQQNRTFRLMNILVNPHATRVDLETVLNTGSIIVINSNIEINEESKLPLIQAFEAKNKPLIYCLLEYGADFETIKKMSSSGINYNNGVLLHVACELNDLNLVNLLLIEGADPALKNKFGKMPVELALENNNTSLATLLLNKLFLADKDIDEVINKKRIDLITKMFLTAVQQKNKNANTISYLLNYWGTELKIININQSCILY